MGSIALDITDHRRRERLMRLTFDESPVPMVRLAWRDGRAAEVLDANRSAADLLKVSAGDLVCHGLDRFIHPHERGISLVPVDGERGRPRNREARLVCGDGQDVWVAVTATVVDTNNKSHHTDNEQVDEAFALVVLEDISARRVAEQTLTHQALHDALTGVLNRYAFIDRLDAAINRLWRDSNHLAVLFCDLDGFKNLNDTLGHRAGDQMLISVSERLRAVMRPQDTVARLGGDEFVLICTDLPSPGKPESLANAFGKPCANPSGLTIATTASPSASVSRQPPSQRPGQRTYFAGPIWRCTGRRTTGAIGSSITPKNLKPRRSPTWRQPKPCVGQSPRTRFLSTTNPLLIWPKVESWGGSPRANSGRRWFVGSSGNLHRCR